MARFIKIPGVNFYGDTDWQLNDTLVYQSDLWADHITVPNGFITDLASIPRIFRSIIPQVGKHRLAAVVHDYLVREEDFDRRLADKIFLEAMKERGVNRVRRRLMYWAVSLHTTWLRRKKK